jgi:RHS repeat-associated protein
LATAQTATAFYNPSTGRWLTRDPAGEDAGELNLNSFVSNAPVEDVHNIGLMPLASDERAVAKSA